ncbi:MAG: C40 family peptidase [Bacteroidales bacterium]
MIKELFKTRGNYIVLFVTGCQLLFTFCSKHYYREPPAQTIERQADNKNLNDKMVVGSEIEINARDIRINKIKAKAFMAGDTEKKINTRNTSPDEIIETARKYLGVPHCMGGTTMKCIDCSGLLLTVFARQGIQLPHNSEEQARYGKKITGMDELKKGDLVFFIRTYNTNQFITHSGIYVGDNKFIHASSASGVTITSLSNPYWMGRFVFGTRVFE